MQTRSRWNIKQALFQPRVQIFWSMLLCMLVYSLKSANILSSSHPPECICAAETSLHPYLPVFRSCSGKPNGNFSQLLEATCLDPLLLLFLSIFIHNIFVVNEHASEFYNAL
jgi:hypothetical protein